MVAVCCDRMQNLHVASLFSQSLQGCWILVYHLGIGSQRAESASPSRARANKDGRLSSESGRRDDGGGEVLSDMSAQWCGTILIPHTEWETEE